MANNPGDLVAAEIRQHEVQEQQVRVTALEQIQPLPGGGCQHRLEAVRRQDRAERPRDLRLVVDDQDARTAHAGAPSEAGARASEVGAPPWCRGSSKRKVAPPPGVSSI